MNRLVFFALIAGVAFDVAARSPADAGLAAVQDLGSLNGQALACGQMAISGKTKGLMLAYAPKTRSYGEAFEEATNAVYLEQGRDQGSCPEAADFTVKLNELSARLQKALPGEK